MCNPNLINPQSIKDVNELRRDIRKNNCPVTNLDTEVIVLMEGLGFVIDLVTGLPACDPFEQPDQMMTRRRIFVEDAGWTIRVLISPSSDFIGFIPIKEGSTKNWPVFQSLRDAYQAIIIHRLPWTTTEDALRVAGKITEFEKMQQETHS